MISVLGHGGALLGLAAGLAGIVTLVTGLGPSGPLSGRASRSRPRLLRAGRTYAFLMLGGALVSVIAMEIALLSDDFSLVYVAENSARATPLIYKIATLWAALEGSILLWGMILAGYIAAAGWRFRARLTEPKVAWALIVAFGVAVFFFGLIIGPADPFRTVAGAVPLDGPGPNPLLQNHPLMAFHPPMLYLGYIGFTIPFAFALGSLITGNFAADWVRETRRWSLAAWGFLTVGIVAGAWWSYEVLGWGGYWAWDPVENASLLPWLTATAYLHSVLVQQRRDVLRVWNLSLVVATFSLTILGTFLTRSGVLDSVHAFTESVVGPAFLSFLGLVVLVSLGLIAWRGDALKSAAPASAPLSREGFFLANNLVFTGFAFVVLIGTIFPLVTEALNGDRVSVGRPYFDRMTSPLALTLLFLMAVAPALRWSSDSRSVWSERLLWPAGAAVAVLSLLVAFGVRGMGALAAFTLGAFAAGTAARQLAVGIRRSGGRALLGASGGGMVAHLGFVVLAVAASGSSAFAQKADVRLEPGESATVIGHRLEYLGAETVMHPNRVSRVALVRIDGGKVYRPALSQFPFATQAIGTPSVRAGLTEDVYLTLVSAPESAGDDVVLGVRVIPLVSWLWTGGGLMGVGTALALAGGSRKRSTPLEVSAVAEDQAPVPELVGTNAR